MGSLVTNMRYLKSLFIPLPSIFDICVGGFLFITLIPGDTNKAIFFVLYTSFLLALSFGMKPKRSYTSIPIAFIVIWSLINIFIHSFVISPSSRTSLYPATYIMEEGFMYVLFGAIFLHTVIRYSTNPKIIFFLIPISIIGWLPDMVYFGNSTPIVAIGLSILIYLFLARKRIAIPITILGVSAVVYKWAWLAMKFRCRPYVWYQLLVNTFYHPVRHMNNQVIDPGVELAPAVEKVLGNIPYISSIKPWLASLFGSGFTQFLDGEYTWVDTTIWNKLGQHKTYTYGWVHLQNDYLHLANCLGPIILIPLFFFIRKSCKTIGVRPLLILFMFVCLVCFAKLTMFKPGTAGIALMIMALCITEGLKREEV